MRSKINRPYHSGFWTGKTQLIFVESEARSALWCAQEDLMRAYILVSLVICTGLVLISGGCSQKGVQVIPATGMSNPDETLADSTVFASEMAGFQDLDPQEQSDRQKQAAEDIGDWRQFEEMARKRRDRRERPYLYEQLPTDRRGLLTGLASTLDRLGEAARLDPADATAWAALGHLHLEIGDLKTARGYLERARWTAMYRDPVARAGDPDLLLEIHRDRGWVLRDLGLWEEGLAAVEEGLSLRPADPELVLIQGLLLAGAGRTQEALSHATKMPPVKIRDFTGVYTTGLYVRPSDYANQWIRSQAYLKAGDLEMAFHVFGERRTPDEPMSIFGGRLDSRANATALPYQRRFWNDVGLVAELRGDPGAMEYYVAGFRGLEYSGYYPTAGEARSSLVLDVPDAHAPYFVSFGHSHYLLGSRFGYVAYQMNAMSMALFPEQARHAAREALEVLDILERYQVRVDVCRAFRGRIFYRLERYAEAKLELKAARDSFSKKDQVDARTSLLLGMIALREEQFTGACGYLEESVRADAASPVAWRMLGVVYANLERGDEAVAAMNRAVALEPRSLVGHYNRGLLFLQLHRCTQALPDLETAWRLDPGNEDVQRLLQVTAACIKSGSEEPLVPGDQTVVRVEGAEVPRFKADPALLLDHLAAELEVFFTPPDSLLGDLSLRAVRLDSAVTVRPEDAQLRKTAALAWLDLGEPVRTRDLLAPWWGVGLSPLEEVMLLWADEELDDRNRISELTRQALSDSLTTSNPYVWRLVVREIRRDPDHWGPDAEDRALARWFDHMNEFTGSSVRYWAESLRLELEVSRQDILAPVN